MVVCCVLRNQPGMFSCQTTVLTHGTFVPLGCTKDGKNQNLSTKMPLKRRCAVKIHRTSQDLLPVWAHTQGALVVYSALTHLSAGCWRFCAHKPVTTSVTACTDISHFPPSLVCPIPLSLLFYSVSILCLPPRLCLLIPSAPSACQILSKVPLL